MGLFTMTFIKGKAGWPKHTEEQEETNGIQGQDTATIRAHKGTVGADNEQV